MIRAFTFDVDGVFTDGSITALADGDLIRTYNSKDTFAVRTAVAHGYPCAVITGGLSNSIIMRFLEMGVPREDIHCLAKNKVRPFMEFCEKYDLRPSEVAYIGDDLPDIPVLEICGESVCPSDAVDQVKAVCSYISPNPGGKRCVREYIEHILSEQGKWYFDADEPWKGGFPKNITDLNEK